VPRRCPFPPDPSIGYRWSVLHQTGKGGAATCAAPLRYTRRETEFVGQICQPGNMRETLKNICLHVGGTSSNRRTGAATRDRRDRIRRTPDETDCLDNGHSHGVRWMRSRAAPGIQNLCRFQERGGVRCRARNWRLWGGHDCQQEHVECMQRCWDNRYPWPYSEEQSGWYHERCIKTCREQFAECDKEQEQALREKEKS
jgi:hypothetical protein